MDESTTSDPSFFSIALASPAPAALASAIDSKIAMILRRGETKAEKVFQQSLKEFGYSAQYTVMNTGHEQSGARSFLAGFAAGVG